MSGGWPVLDPSGMQQFWASSTMALSKPLKTLCRLYKTHFKDVFEDVFHGPNCAAHLDVDMGVELQKQAGIVRYDVTVVGFHADLKAFRAEGLPTFSLLCG